MLLLLTVAAALAGSLYGPEPRDSLFGTTIGDTRASIRRRCGGPCPERVAFAGGEVKPSVAFCGRSDVVGIAVWYEFVPDASWIARGPDRRTFVVTDDARAAIAETMDAIRLVQEADGWTTTVRDDGFVTFRRGALERHLSTLDTFLVFATGAASCDPRLATGSAQTAAPSR